MISGLEIGLHLPHHVFAGQSYAGAVLLHNRRWLPAFSISVVPPMQKADSPGLALAAHPICVSSRRAPDAGRSFAGPTSPCPKLSAAQGRRPSLSRACISPIFPAGHRQSAELNLSFPRRGLYAQRGVGISTRFPFSFLAKTRTVALDQEVLVYPSVEATDEMFEVLPIITGELETNQRGRGSDLYRIRDYEPEDSARHVDWKATAKSGELKVREYTREDERRVCIIFDNPAPGVLDSPHYERAINLAASIAWHFFEENTELSFAAPSLYPECGCVRLSRISCAGRTAPGPRSFSRRWLHTDSTTSSSRLVRTDRFPPRSGNPPTFYLRKTDRGRGSSRRATMCNRAIV